MSTSSVLALRAPVWHRRGGGFGKFPPLAAATLGALFFIISNGIVAGVAFAQPPADAVPAEVVGELTVLHGDDFDHKRSEQLYLLDDKANRRQFRIRFEGEPPADLRSGAKVKVRGKARDQELYLAADGTANIEVIASAAALVSGEQKTLVMVANFTDSSVSCSSDSIRNVLFADPSGRSVDKLYQETSHGAVQFTGNVTGPYTINFTSTAACDVNAWATAAENAAQAKGVDLNAFSRRVYVLPSSNTCGWSGLASVGGNPSRAWIFRCDLEGVYPHELGHNLGMNHASTPTNEYGDSSDFMGSAMSGFRQINAAHQEQMGWRQPDRYLTVTQSGTYDIAPLELEPAQTVAPQILKIAKPDTGEYYYLSYRQPLGFDANLNSELVKRLQIHRYQGTGGRTWNLRNLLAGESFIDDMNGVTITHISRTPEYLTVQVQFNAACTASAPTISLSPTSQSGNAGSTLNYTVSVANKDSTNCGQSTFSLNKVLPSGWSGAFSPASLTLAAGATGTATMAVTSASSAAAGTYTVQLNATDAANTIHTASTSGSYAVLASCSRAAPTVSFTPASQSGNAGATLNYTVSVTNKDSTGCAQSSFSLNKTLPSGWAGTLSSSSLVLSPGATGTATLAVTSASSAAAGAYTVQANATDAANASHAASGSGSYAVQVQTDTQAPTAPSNLKASVKRNQVNLTWSAATDNVGVAGYRILRNGAMIGTTTTIGYADPSTGLSGTYTYAVVAYDAAGNVSTPSNSITVTITAAKK